MGFILESEGNVGGEARRESFVIFEDRDDASDYDSRIELEWEDLPALKRMVEKLEEYHTMHQSKDWHFSHRTPGGTNASGADWSSVG